jgi:peptidoglycan/LPS O-acetylase OafA/YrhL
LAVGLALIGLSLAVRDPWFRDALRFGLQGVGLFFAVGNVLYSERTVRPRQVLSSPVARALGRWSYSLYLWHWLVLIAALRLLPEDLREAAHQGGLPPGQWALFTVPVAVLSIAAAAASHRWVERPILALRRRFGAHPVEAASSD